MSKQTDEIESVVVSEEARPVTVVNADGELVTLGTVISRVYEGEAVQRHEFISGNLTEDEQELMANPKLNRPEKRYKLGPTTTKFNFVDHAQAIQPLVENGFQVQTMKLGRGGLSIYTVLEPVKPLTLDDPITWDEEFWPRTDKKGERTQCLYDEMMEVEE